MGSGEVSVTAEMRARVRQFLPRALERALASYKFIAAQKFTEAAEIKKQHDACKVAIAHVQLLINVADWVDAPPAVCDGDGVDQDVLRGLIESAQAELG